MLYMVDKCGTTSIKAAKYSEAQRFRRTIFVYTYTYVYIHILHIRMKGCTPVLQ